MDDEIIHSWCLHDVECFDSTPSAAIIILDKDLGIPIKGIPHGTCIKLYSPFSSPFKYFHCFYLC